MSRAANRLFYLERPLRTVSQTDSKGRQGGELFHIEPLEPYPQSM